jgi:hypothetical protein
VQCGLDADRSGTEDGDLEWGSVAGHGFRDGRSSGERID